MTKSLAFSLGFVYWVPQAMFFTQPDQILHHLSHALFTIVRSRDCIVTSSAIDADILLSVGQSYDGPSANEATMNDTGIYITSIY